MDALVVKAGVLVRRPLTATVALSLLAILLFRLFSVQLRRWWQPGHREQRRRRHSHTHSRSHRNSTKKEIKKSLPNVVLLLGIPGSGKTTWADQYIRRCDRSYIVIAADSLRAKISTDASEAAREEEVRTAIIEEVKRHVSEKHNVIIDDYNHPLDAAFRQQILAAVPASNHLIMEFSIKPLFARVRLDKDIEQGKRQGGPTDLELENMEKAFNVAHAQVTEEGWIQLLDVSQHSHRSKRG